MSIKININRGTTKVNIIKDEKEEKEQIELMVDNAVQAIMNHPESQTKARELGEDKIRSMAKAIVEQIVKENEQKQIDSAMALSEELAEAMIKDLVKGAMQIAKEI